MTNPNNAVGTNGAYNGRTSVNAFNDNLAVYTGRGVISGWAMAPDSAMTITIGGEAGTRDVAVAEDSAGNRTSIDNISGAPISVTIPAAPASGSRIDLVVAYVVNPPQGSDTSVDNPAACGLIVVSGTPSSTPVAPNESAIRSAITADGAAGSTAYYVVLGQATIPNGTTTITSDMLMVGAYASVGSQNIDFASFAKAEIKSATGTYDITTKSVIIATCEFESTVSGDSNRTISFAGASGTVYSPAGTQNGNQYIRGRAFGFALCAAGDSVSISTTGSNSQMRNISILILPCNW